MAGGKVPGDMKSYSLNREGVTNWREGAKVLDSGMATVLQVSEVVCCCLLNVHHLEVWSLIPNTRRNRNTV